MTVIYVRPARSKGYLSVGIKNGGEKMSFTVPEDVYVELGSVRAEDEIEGEEYARMREADELYRARIKALQILSFADNSRIALIRKLVSRGFSRSVSELVADEMASRGYINEKRALAALIKDEVNLRLVGPQKLFPKLMAKGYSRSDIEEVVSSLCELCEIDFEASKARLIEKKLGDSPEREEVKKLLYKSGYTVCSDDF